MPLIGSKVLAVRRIKIQFPEGELLVDYDPLILKSGELKKEQEAIDTESDPELADLMFLELFCRLVKWWDYYATEDDWKNHKPLALTPDAIGNEDVIDRPKLLQILKAILDDHTQGEAKGTRITRR